jgi:hypothetical protein
MRWKVSLLAISSGDARGCYLFYGVFPFIGGNAGIDAGNGGF